MVKSKARILKLCIGVLIFIVIAAVFIFSCYATASDAQGALIFIFTLPALAILFLIGYCVVYAFASRQTEPQDIRLRKILSRLIGFELAFILLFFSSVFVPPLRVFSDGVIGGVAKTFEAFSGFSPYAWAHRDKNMKK